MLAQILGYKWTIARIFFWGKGQTEEVRRLTPGSKEKRARPNISEEL